MQIKIVLISSCFWVSFASFAQSADPHAAIGESLFLTSSHCIACHSNLKGPDGSDISIGTTWRSTMMANSARDPYWHAAVRREVTDHPSAQAEIENECSTCHMPMAHFVATTEGELTGVFANIAAMHADPAGNLAAMHADPAGNLAADGVSCTVCHQIRPDNFGTESSFVGGFVIDTETPAEERSIYGPHEVDAGRRRVMHSATGFAPQTADYLKQSELCATCHTLYTHALDDQGQDVGRLPEQMPYLEWLESDYRNSQSCQDCHMPALTKDTPISSVLGQPRPAFSQHVFRGGNSFVLTLLSKYRDELGVKALPVEIDASVRRTKDYLKTLTAGLEITSARRSGDDVVFDVSVTSKSGHKLPTAYPARRVWLHVTVSDSAGNVLFESGALRPDGSIVGNANDDDARDFEPHYDEITRDDQVQIYEAIMVDWQNRVTTGLIYGVGYVKDNRLLPAGFDKQIAADDVAVSGAALTDDDFLAGGDHLRYRLPIPSRSDLKVRAELVFQSIGYRWAENLSDYPTEETERFVRYYRDTIEGSAVTLAADSVTID
jgi:hypothetical protein